MQELRDMYGICGAVKDLVIAAVVGRSWVKIF